MDPETQNSLRTRAIEWHVRLRDGDDATWDAFTDWLEQDPQHRAAYDAVEAIDLAIEPLLPKLTFPTTAPGTFAASNLTAKSLPPDRSSPANAPEAIEATAVAPNSLPPKSTFPPTPPVASPPAPPMASSPTPTLPVASPSTQQPTAHEVSPPPPRRVALRRWHWLAGTALAASIAAVLALLPQLSSTRYDITTRPGQQRTIALDADTVVILNGSTHATFDRNNPRFAALQSGEALFRVHHDTAHPFTLEVGNTRIQDVGTVFNVVRDPHQLRLTVAEGEVLYHALTQSVPLSAGQLLVAATESGSVQVTTIPLASVGAWQKGRLVYSGEPLSQVAADLGRSLGIPIEVSPALQNRPFSGAIVLAGTGANPLERLKGALHVNLQAGPDGWTMTPLDDGRH